MDLWQEVGFQEDICYANCLKIQVQCYVSVVKYKKIQAANTFRLM